MDREAWHATVYGIAKSPIQLSEWTELKEVEAFEMIVDSIPVGKKLKKRLVGVMEIEEWEIVGRESEA